jgi:hypothetical protein
MSDAEHKPLMFDAMVVEWATAHACHATVAAQLERYRLALGGIASCATDCGCCRLHAQIAATALSGE